MKNDHWKDYARVHLRINSSMIDTAIFLSNLLEKVSNSPCHWATGKAYRFVPRRKAHYNTIKDLVVLASVPVITGRPCLKFNSAKFLLDFWRKFILLAKIELLIDLFLVSLWFFYFFCEEILLLSAIGGLMTKLLLRMNYMYKMHLLSLGERGRSALNYQWV